MDERLDKIETMLRDIQEMILDMPRANREYGLYKPSPFNAKPEDLDKPKIPNGPDDPPPVWETGIVKTLVLFNVPKLGLRWYADLGASVAEIRPFTTAQEEHFTGCGDPVPEAYSYGTLRYPGHNWEVFKTVRNPLAPEPECCGE